MKIVITGINGFIGANLAMGLIRDEHRVYGIDHTPPNWRCHGLAEVEHFALNISDYQSINALFHKLKPDLVFHLAAYGCYPRFQTDDNLLIETNVLGSLNVMKAAQENNVKRIVQAGTSSEYGLQSSMTEEAAPRPYQLYGATKAAATMLGHVFSANGLDVITLRLFSAYGPFEDPRRLIPYLISAAFRKEKAFLTRGDQVRDFVFIDDIYRAFCQAGTSEVPPGIYNVGTGKQTSVKEVASIVCELFDGDFEFDLGAIEHPTDRMMFNWRAEMEKSRGVLHFVPEVALRAGLNCTIKWFKDNYDHLKSIF